MFNARGVEFRFNKKLGIWKGDEADIIRFRVSEALRKVNSGDYFRTKPIFIEAKAMADIENDFLKGNSIIVEKIHKFCYYPVVEDDITYHEELDRNWIVKKRDTNHHCTDWYFCETFILDHFLQDWWGVATRAALGQSVVGQANTTTLSGDMGSIRFEYNS